MNGYRFTIFVKGLPHPLLAVVDSGERAPLEQELQGRVERWIDLTGVEDPDCDTELLVWGADVAAFRVEKE